MQITEKQVASLVTPDDAFQTTKQAHIDLTTGRAVNVVRSRARLSNAALHVLEAASCALDAAGAKVYIAGRGGMRSHFLLYRASTCELLATIEANELGRLRTAAASAVAAAALTPGLRGTLAVVGSGFQAEGAVRALAAKSAGLNLERIIVSSRHADRAEKLAGELSHAVSQKVSSAPVDEAVSAAELVLTVTTSSQPVVQDGWLQRAKLVCAAGSNSLARVEIPPRAVTASRAVIVDSLAVAQNEAGDLLTPAENGKLLWSQVRELGHVLVHGISTEQSEGYFFFCSQGLAVQDLYLANLIYQRAKNA